MSKGVGVWGVPKILEHIFWTFYHLRFFLKCWKKELKPRCSEFQSKFWVMLLNLQFGGTTSAVSELGSALAWKDVEFPNWTKLDQVEPICPILPEFKILIHLNQIYQFLQTFSSIYLCLLIIRPGLAVNALQRPLTFIGWLITSPFSSKSSKHDYSQTVRARELTFWEDV